MVGLISTYSLALTDMANHHNSLSCGINFRRIKALNDDTPTRPELPLFDADLAENFTKAESESESEKRKEENDAKDIHKFRRVHVISTALKNDDISASTKNQTLPTEAQTWICGWCQRGHMSSWTIHCMVCGQGKDHAIPLSIDSLISHEQLA